MGKVYESRKFRVETSAAGVNITRIATADECWIVDDRTQIVIGLVEADGLTERDVDMKLNQWFPDYVPERIVDWTGTRFAA